MASIQFNEKADRQHEPEYDFEERPAEDKPDHPLDSEENRRLLAKLEDWWHITRQAHAENRYEQEIDEDFYDHHQISDQDRAILEARGQYAGVYNRIHVVIDWLLGTQRRARIDWDVLPRREEDLEIAGAKKKLMKYISDTSRAQYERSMAKDDATKVGVGWIEEGVRTDKLEEPVFIRHRPYKEVWPDPHSKRQDLDDARFIFTTKWMDLDVAKALWPDRAAKLEAVSVQNVYADAESPDDDSDLPMLYTHLDQFGRTVNRRSFSGDAGAPKNARRRVRIATCWHRLPVEIQRITGYDWHGEEYDESDEAMRESVSDQRATLTDAMTFHVYSSSFVPGALLEHGRSPYRHERLPFTAYYCFRQGRDGMPYGFIRGLRDAQESLNKRMSKALFALNTNQVMAEEGAIEDWDEFMDQVARPNGELRVKDGWFDKVALISGREIAKSQFEYASFDKEHIDEGSGVNRENRGLESGAESGKAIIAKQQEGSVTTAMPYDNYKLGDQISGEKTLSLIEQFMTAEKQIRIVGERGKLGFEKFNTPVWDESIGDYVIENDITASKADFVIAEQAFHETIRQAQVEQLLEVVKTLGPEVSMQVLDMVVDMMDIPAKEEFARRIRKLNGQFDPDEEESPEQQQAMFERQQADQQEKMLSDRERMAKILKDESSARKQDADANQTKISTKKEALETAGALHLAAPLAPAADQLMATPEEAQQ